MKVYIAVEDNYNYWATMPWYKVCVARCVVWAFERVQGWLKAAER